MKKILVSALAIVLALSSCNKLNELESRVGDVEDRVGNLEDRVKALEDELNDNIASLQAAVRALQNHDYVTEVRDVTDAQGNVIGYELVFAKSATRIIYHGKDGDPGHSPAIGIAKDTDGLYYWTLDGQWLLSGGQKVIAVGVPGTPGEPGAPGTPGTPGTPGEPGAPGSDGTDGADGITPQLKIQEGSWYVSYDNGETWAELGIATDISSSDLFTAVYRDANDLVLELRDGTSYRIPIGSSLSIEYDCGPVVTVEPGSTRTIHYTVDSSTGEATVEVFSSADLLVKTENETALEGDIVVKCGAALTEYSKIVVLVHNGLRVHTDRFSFEEEGLVLSDNSEKTVAATAGTVELEFMTNAEFEVVVPTDVTWITVSETRALVAHGATLSILANEGLKRSAQVKVKSKTSDLEIVYTIIQEGTLKQLGITHRLGAFTVPTLTGDTTSGLVNWGDGASDSWSAGLSHNYIDNQASHTVVIAMKGIDSFALGNLTGITEIDASAL